MNVGNPVSSLWQIELYFKWFNQYFPIKSINGNTLSNLVISIYLWKIRHLFCVTFMRFEVIIEIIGSKGILRFCFNSG